MRVDVEPATDLLRVRFEPVEKLFGLVPDLDVPVCDVVAVERLRDPWTAMGRWRVGVGLHGLWVVGTTWRRGSRQLVAVRRDQPTLRLALRRGAAAYDELLLSTPHPESVEARLAGLGVRTGRLLLVGAAVEPRSHRDRGKPPAARW